MIQLLVRLILLLLTVCAAGTAWGQEAPQTPAAAAATAPVPEQTPAPLPTPAPEQTPAAEGEAQGSEESTSAPADTTPSVPAEGTPAATPTGEPKVAPLGEWVPVEQPAEKAEEAARRDWQKEREEERRIFIELLQKRAEEEQAGDEVEVPPPLVRKVVPSRLDQKRFKEIYKRRARELRKQREWLRALEANPGRGPAELRICTLDLGNYSTPEMQKRIARGSRRVSFKKRERELVRSIIQAECSVLAVQAVIGQTHARAKESLERLRTRLEKAGGFGWKAYLGPSNHRLAYNGFLVSEYGGSVATVRSYAGRELPRFGEFRREQFPRGPFELELEVQNRRDGSKRRVVLLTMDLRISLEEQPSDAEQLRMQGAEALRTIIRERQRQLTGPAPIFVLLGVRGAPQNAPSTRILEGALELRSFGANGPCTVKTTEVEVKPPRPKKKEPKEKKAKRTKPKVEYVHVPSCSGAPPTAANEAGSDEEPPALLPGGPKMLFGLSTETQPPPPPIAVRTIDGEEKLVMLPHTKRAMQEWNKRRSKHSEIYIIQEDLRWFQRRDDEPMDFATGQIELQTGDAKSPLIWAELNW